MSAVAALNLERLTWEQIVFRKTTVNMSVLPPAFDDIDGLLGLGHLDDFDYTIRSLRNEIAVALAAP